METHNSRWKALKPVGHLMTACFLFNTAAPIIVPFMADIMLGAFCPGQLQCSRVVLLTSALQLGVGFGSVFLGPILGSVSDDYGRRPILGLLFWLAVIPPVALAYSLSPTAVYVWYAAVILFMIARDGCFLPGVLAYLADAVGESERSSAVGFTMACFSVGMILGTSAIYVVTSLSQAMWTSAAVQTAAAIYFTLFVKESNPRKLPLSPEQPQSEASAKLLPKPEIRSQMSKLKEAAKTIWSSKLLKRVAIVDFLNNSLRVSTHTFNLYYLKAKFNFGKDEFASYGLFSALGLAMGEMLYPVVAHNLGDKATLCIGVMGTAIHYLLFAVAWNTWVAYIGGSFYVIASFVAPTLGTMVSKGVVADQQGRIQGYMGGIRSAGVLFAPLVVTPLTANAMSKSPLFNNPGFPYYFCFTIMMVAFLIALRTPSLPTSKEQEKLSTTDYIEAPQPHAS